MLLQSLHMICHKQYLKININASHVRGLMHTSHIFANIGIVSDLFTTP